MSGMLFMYQTITAHSKQRLLLGGLLILATAPNVEVHISIPERVPVLLKALLRDHYKESWRNANKTGTIISIYTVHYIVSQMVLDQISAKATLTQSHPYNRGTD